MSSAIPSEMPGKRPKARAVPIPMVSGSPTASIRSTMGESTSSRLRRMVEAALKSTSASVTSARMLSMSGVGRSSMTEPAPAPPMMAPMTRKAKAADTDQRASRTASMP